MLVLWVIGLLSILVGSMAFEAHLEANLTTYYRNKFKAEYLARSGLEIAELIMAESIKAKGRSEDDAEGDKWYQPALRLADGLGISGLTETLGNGVIRIDIQPEPAKRNVNRLDEEDWERVFEVAGVPEEIWPVLIDSVMDWRDKDSERRRDGAETEDYYAYLEPPYRAKNGDLDAVDELLLVRGFSRTILSGGYLPKFEGDEQPDLLSGIEDLLTVYGDGKVNVNAASQRVLMTLPGVDEIIAGAIIEEREGLSFEEAKPKDTSFKSVADLYARIPGLDEEMKNYVVTVSTIYKVTSVGEVHGVTRKINCVGSFVRGGFKYLRWWEDE